MKMCVVLVSQIRKSVFSIPQWRVHHKISQSKDIYYCASQHPGPLITAFGLSGRLLIVFSEDSEGNESMVNLNYYSATPKCMATFNVFTYFWHNHLVAKHTHSSVWTLRTVRVSPSMTQSNECHTGIFVFDSQIVMPKVCNNTLYYINYSVLYIVGISTTEKNCISTCVLIR
jgi:hypothetical protein